LGDREWAYWLSEGEGVCGALHQGRATTGSSAGGAAAAGGAAGGSSAGGSCSAGAQSTWGWHDGRKQHLRRRKHQHLRDWP
jgi:hypothetical protein